MSGSIGGGFFQHDPTIVSGTLAFGDDEEAVFGNGTDATLGWNTAQTNHALVLGIATPADATGAGALLIVDQANVAGDYGVAASANPIVYIFSATAAGTATDQYLSLTHNATDAVLTVGAGDLEISAAQIRPPSGAAMALARQDGTAWATTSTTTNVTTIGIGTRFNDNVWIDLGTGGDVRMLWGTAQATANNMVIGIGVGSSAQGGGVILTAYGNLLKDHDHSAASNPTLFIHSATDPDTANNQYLSFDHVVSAGRIGTGVGLLNLRPGLITALALSSTSNTTTAEFTQTLSASGTPKGLLWTAGAHTGLTVAETIDQHWDNGRTVTFTTGGGTIALQRSVVFEAPTYAAGSATTITDAFTAYIDSAPVAGSNITITRSHALGLGGRLTLFTSVDSVAVADQVSLSRYEIGAGNTVLAISQETAVAADADETKFSHKMQCRINGATYFLMLTQT